MEIRITMEKAIYILLAIAVLWFVFSGDDHVIAYFTWLDISHCTTKMFLLRSCLLFLVIAPVYSLMVVILSLPGIHGLHQGCYTFIMAIICVGREDKSIRSNEICYSQLRSQCPSHRKLRLKLCAEGGGPIPQPYPDLMIHGLNTLDYPEDCAKIIKRRLTGTRFPSTNTHDRY